MLRSGPPPRIPYVYGGHTLVVPREAPQALPAPLDSVSALLPLRGGWLVASHTGADGSSTAMSTQGFAEVTRFDGSMHPVWTRLGAAGFAVSGTDSASFTVPDRTEPPGHLALLAADGKTGRRWTIPFEQVAVPVGITSRDAVVYDLTTAHGTPRGAWVTGVRGAPRRLPLSSAAAATGELVAGRLRNGCAGVLRGRAELWRRCDGFRLAAFSPDGRYVAAWHTETGGEFESAYVLDARTGRRVTDTSVGSPDSFHGLPSGAIAWEDDRHVLLAYDDGASGDWEVLRLGLGGRLERATGAFRQRNGGEAVFVFAPWQSPGR